MNLFDAVERFLDQDSCIKHLDAVLPSEFSFQSDWHCIIILV